MMMRMLTDWFGYDREYYNNKLVKTSNNNNNQNNNKNEKHYRNYIAIKK